MEHEEERGEFSKSSNKSYQGAFESSFERDDERWSSANQARDWLTLAIIAAVEAAWMIITYLLEPGIR